MQSAARAAPWPVAEQAEIVPPGPLDFDELYERWFDDVARWIRALGGPEADRDDLVQDVFVVVHRRLPDFDGQNVAGWLYQIARRKVRDFRRLLWVKHLFTGSVQLSDRIGKAGPNPADKLEVKEQGELLERLLSSLNEEQRAAFVLFEVEGYSGEEIAKIQGVPINTVWARIHKARKKLQAGISRFEKQSARQVRS